MSLHNRFDHLKIELRAIKIATNNFASENCIGAGGFGKVYKGELKHSEGHTTVAIKILDRRYGQGDPEFWKQIMFLSHYRHPNVVSLLGFCDEDKEKILVYEYASRGSLDGYIGSDLTWVQRLNICIGAARGLAYLHNPDGTQQRVLHRDMKSSNILLDENWKAMIADLGLSKFGPANQEHSFLVSQLVGTAGYCDPNYLVTGFLTKESDVYSFGVVLFEVFCGRLVYASNNKSVPLTRLVRDHYEQDKMKDIIHGSIKDEIHPDSMNVFTTLAYQCLNDNYKQRPLMTDVIVHLEVALRLQVQENKEVDIKGELLSVRPKELRIPFELMKEISTSIQLKNRTYSRVAFKLKTRRPSTYTAQPHTGILLPQSTCQIQLTMQPQKEDPVQCDDKFMVQSAVVSPRVTLEDITRELFSKESGNQVEKYIINVSFVAPKHLLLRPKEDVLPTTSISNFKTTHFRDSNISLTNISLREVPMKEIEVATEHFKMCIWENEQYQIYKGELSISGAKPTLVFIKRFCERSGDINQFSNQLRYLPDQLSPNIVSVLGYCAEDRRKIIVHEYAERGSLDQYISRRSNTTSATLTWRQRLQICVGAAHGVHQLHYGGIPLGIFTSAKVLLDDKWVAKVCDFMISAPSSTGLDDIVAGHVYSGRVSSKVDVYSFGVVLFEVLCGMLFTEEVDGYMLSAKLVKELYEKKKLDEIVDPVLRAQKIRSDSVYRYSAIAYKCLLDDPKERPTIDAVIKELEELLRIERPTVPKFGNWESEDNVPYTIYFDKARKGKTGGKMINPNDPQENPEMFADNKTPPHPVSRPRSYAEPEEPVHRRAVRRREESEYPLPNDNTGRRTSGGSAHQRGGQGVVAGRQAKGSLGSDQSFDKSPLHPHYQAKVGAKGSGSPAWEGKNSYDSSHGTPGRSRMKPARGDETVDDYDDDDRNVSVVTCVPVKTLPPTQLDVYETKNPEYLDTHNSALNAIMAALEDESKQIIGIYGLGGVGKTTLAKEVVARVKKTNMLFADVAFTTVSQKVDVEKIKKDLKNATTRMMIGDQVLIILEDVWEKLNLEELGIQCGNTYMNCKILLTSRSEKVCEQMSAQSIIRVNSLPIEEAWILFKRVVGDRLETDATLKPIALKVVEECSGLPLLIQAIGNALKDESIELWESALSQLKKPAASDMEQDIKKAFTRLQLSYEHLKSEEAKSCFLLCSIFAEEDDISLEDLVCYWVGIKNFDSIEDARDKVQNAVNILISSGLLLNSKWEGYTKMHDVVREVALLIASEGESKFLVEAGKGLKDWLPEHNLERYTGISLMKNCISKLPDYQVHLSSLHIFLVNKNPLLRMISDEFIKSIKEVKVLDMGWCLISHLPQSLKLLTKLRMLNLEENYFFHEISILGEMKELEILILNRTGIKEIPKEIGMLVNLRRLEVSRCRYMTRVTQGVISKLQSLEELCIDISRMSEGANGCIAEVAELWKLTYLDLVVKSCEVIPEGFNSEKLKGFVIQIGEYHRDFYRGNELRRSDRYLIISSKHLVLPLLKRIKKFIVVSHPVTILNGIQNLNNIMPDMCYGGFNKLEHVQLNYCHNVSCLVEDGTSCDGDEGKTVDMFFQELKHLKLWYLDNLEVLCKYDYTSLTNLVSLSIEGCDKLERVFTLNVTQSLVNLKKLEVESCSGLKEVIWGGGGGDDESRNVIVFPSLATISLVMLERLEGFFNSTGKCSIQYPSLVYVKIHDCESMKIWGPGFHETPNLKSLEMNYGEPIVVDGPFAINEAVEKIWRQ